jgi:hypothetical protein
MHVGDGLTAILVSITILLMYIFMRDPKIFLAGKVRSTGISVLETNKLSTYM